MVQDYGEIFGGSGASIPVLDVPELNESEMVVDVLSSKLNYSNIFGGSAEFDFAASHEQLLAKPEMEKKYVLFSSNTHFDSVFGLLILVCAIGLLAESISMLLKRYYTFSLCCLRR